MTGILTSHQATEQAITQAAKLYQIRATVRHQLGEHFPAVMREHIDWLRRISRVSGQSVMQVAIQAAKELEAEYQHTAAAIVLAAAVEEAEPSITEGRK